MSYSNFGFFLSVCCSSCCAIVGPGNSYKVAGAKLYGLFSLIQCITQKDIQYNAFFCTRISFDLKVAFANLDNVRKNYLLSMLLLLRTEINFGKVESFSDVISWFNHLFLSIIQSPLQSEVLNWKSYLIPVIDPSVSTDKKCMRYICLTCLRRDPRQDICCQSEDDANKVILHDLNITILVINVSIKG